MGLLEQISEDTKQAMKGRQAQKLSTLRMLNSALKNAKIEMKKELNESDVLKVVQQQAKQLKEAFDAAVRAEREDLAVKAKEELDILKKYLPEPMSMDELEDLVKGAIEELKAEAADMGKVMGKVMQNVKGRAEGNQVKEMVQRLLK